jgi:16S rRNA processing protein RimM
VVGRAHGLDGSFRVEGAVDWFAYAQGERLLVGGVERVIRSRRGDERAPVVRLDGVEAREEAEALRGQALELPVERLPAPEQDAFYVFDLVGCEVVCAGERLGTVREVLDRPANDVLVVDGPQGELFLPFTVDAVPHVDVASRRIEVREGLLPDEEEQ